MTHLDLLVRWLAAVERLQEAKQRFVGADGDGDAEKAWQEYCAAQEAMHELIAETRYAVAGRAA